MAMIFDCSLPSTWYNHSDQAELLAAGIKVPVYKKSLEAVLSDGDGPVYLPGKTDIVYVPHFGDKSLDNVYDAHPDFGNPLANEDPNKMCLLITPPIAGFDYSKFRHGIPVTGDDICDDPAICDELVQVVEGYLPESFRFNAVHVQDMSVRTLAYATRNTPRFEVLGAKLSPLSSGKANIVMFLKFETECPFDNQMYIPIRDTNMKIRIIPKPIITTNSNTKLHNLDIVIKVLNLDDNLFDFAYRFASNIVSHDLKIHMRHIRTEKGNNNLIIAGHSLSDINLSPYVQKTLTRKIMQGLVPYMVKDVTFKVYDN